MKRTSLLIFLLGSIGYTNSYAQLTSSEEADLEKLEKSATPAPELNERAMLSRGLQKDETTGLVTEKVITNDSFKISLVYNFNSDIKSAMDVGGFEFNIARRFGIFWAEFFGQKISANFNEITEVNSYGSLTASEDLDLTSEDLTIFGGGVSFLSHYIRDIFPSSSLYENIGGDLAYYQLSENYSGEKYQGPGIRSHFGIHVRSSETVHLGLKLNYHLASVKKALVYEGQPSKERSLTLSWVTFGGELSFYF